MAICEKTTFNKHIQCSLVNYQYADLTSLTLDNFGYSAKDKFSDELLLGGGNSVHCGQTLLKTSFNSNDVAFQFNTAILGWDGLDSPSSEAYF